MKTIIVAILLILELSICSIAQESELNKEVVAFSTDVSQLEGYLVKPKDETRFPVIIFIHGDGGIDREMFGAYVPI